MKTRPNEYKSDNNEITKEATDSPTSSVIPANEIKLKKQLGIGGFGKVYAGFWNKKAIALKVLNPYHQQQAEELEKFKTEINLSMQLNHPNVVTTYGASLHTGGTIGMVMERMDCSLYDFIVENEPLGSCDLTHKIMYQAFNGIKYIHEQNIIHRDIKPDNFLIRNPDDAIEVKLCDFGLVIKTNDISNISVIVGGRKYIAPEIIKHIQYSTASDIFAAGCVFQEVITHLNCYYSDTYDSEGNETTEGIYDSILNNRRMPLPYNTNRLFAEIINASSSENKDNRPTAEEITNRLKLR